MLPCREAIKGFGGLILNASKSGFSRNYGRKVVPVVASVKNPTKETAEAKMEMKKARSEMKKNLRVHFNTTDAVLEPDIDNIGGVFDEYQKDYEKLDKTIRRQIVVRKHFKEFTEKEVSVLTWAEKEKIRFLHNSDPNEWNEETLSAVFPVSPNGVLKLLKSSFRARSLKEIETHDLNLADRIKRIKSGEIPMTPDLEEKMKIRDQLPLYIGAIGPHDEKLLIKSQLPKIIGEFARLVTPVKTESSSASSDEMMLTMPAAIASLSDPEVGDSYMLKNSNEDAEEFKSLNIHPNQRITLSQFESRIKQGISHNETESPNQEVEYLRNLEEKAPVKPVSLSEAGISEDAIKIPELEDYLNYHTIPKFKSSKEDAVAEKYARYTKNRDSDSQTHRSNSQDNDHIHVPSELRQSGSVFKRGDSYYDENGEFMYRVV